MHPDTVIKSEAW